MKNLSNEISKSIIDLFLRLSSSMLSYNNQDDFIKNSLGEIGFALNVERAYTFELVDNNWRNIFSWEKPNWKEFKNLINVGQSVYKAFVADGMSDNFSAGRPYILYSLDQIACDEARGFLKGQEIDSLVLVPLFSNGKLTSFFGVDQCKNVDNWANSITNTMVTIGYLLNNAIHYFNAIDNLQKKEEEAQSLLDVLPFPIFITNPNTNNFLCYNKSLTEYAEGEDVSSSTCHKIMYDLDEPCLFCKSKIPPIKGESIVWDSYNSKFNMDFKVINSSITWDEIENARLTIALDISDSLRLQREQVLERESSIAKGRFLANMSHELRTPLNGIIGMTHLAIQNNKELSVGNYLKKIKESSKKLLVIINDILDFSKMEAGKLELEQHAFSPLDVFTNIKEQLLQDAKIKNIALNFVVDDNVPPLLVGDSLRLSQIICHLVENAIKFTEVKGHVTYTLKMHHKQNNSEAKVLCLTVQDTGIGISHENLQNLFVGFSQADASSTRRYGGTGLGLAIVEGLVELMSGSISVFSTEGEGTVFTCIIPFMLPDETELYTSLLPTDLKIEGLCILLAEDNDINSLIAYEMLKQAGCTVDCVQNGQEVLNAINKTKYDVILMDVQMPIMDGIEATKHIRESKAFDSLPIIALTAHILKEEIDKCYDAGMQSHVHKPISTNALYQNIAKYTQGDFKFER